jgi:hypothetical protein
MSKSLKDILGDLDNNGSQVVAQLKEDAKQTADVFLSHLKDQVLTDQQKEDIAWATTQLTAAPVLSVGADDKTTGILNRNSGVAIAVLADIAAVKAMDADAAMQEVTARALSIAQSFVLRGEQLLITAALAAL